MTVRAFLLLFAVASALAGCGGSASEEPVGGWTHDPEDETGPARWASVDEANRACGSGTKQSPVDLGSAVRRSLPPIEVDYRFAPLSVENTGHTIEVETPPGTAHRLTVGDDVYRLVQYHFHTPSEHTVGGRRFDMEAHLVHEGEGGALAVLAVFLTDDKPPSTLVTSVFDAAPDDAGEEAKAEGQASPAGLLPTTGAAPVRIERYTTYGGSLTTPDCSEDVRWLVLTDTVGVSGAAVERMRELVAAFPGYDGFGRNNRPVQGAGGRQISRDDG